MKKLDIARLIKQPITLSISLHSLLLAGAIYFSADGNDLLLEPEGENAISVVMVNPAMFAAPQLSDIQTEPEPIVEEELEPIVEEVIETQPEPIQESIVEKQPEPKPITEVKPKPIVEKTKQTTKSTAAKIQNNISAPIIASETMAPVSSTGLSLDAGPRPLNRGQPLYPKRAFDSRTEGVVKAIYDINALGRVENIRIIFSQPEYMFDREVRQAMKKWRYEKKQAQNLEVTIEFKIQGGVVIK